ncbi:2-oxo acid dehydrogenase subunit E2 [Pseudobdellovibrio exovorus]|uniref:Dihydrolipoamide acetyltransferase component of pyruvate dehydrogenase complex n=1 Tax=Pseudobdellovibrio exovorus JSS TaxID=1184267 RepID=M4V6B7_9BACT|nr:2-oxo acid dehydrogenase subunit E2 [Pseudobdellovibrio exovorus]AGH94917.1 pyruvate dehydrogenase E2 [Pseudobdellovibrio exovorus JSS]
MATDVRLPELGEGVTEGELVKWTVNVGDTVKPDQTVAEIMTDKATVEVPSPVAGVVKELKFKKGDIIKVESVILTLDSAAGATKAAPAAEAAKQTAPSAAPAASAAASTGASTDVKLPELGEGVTEGELVKWTVNVGDTVKPDQTVAEIMTDKATVEVPSPVAGVVKELKFKKGDIIKVESVILTLSGAAATASAPAKTAEKAAAPATASSSHSTSHSSLAPASMAAASTTGAAIYPPVADSKVLATPATRRLAREMGVDINGLNGSGLAGRVTRDDVLASKGGSSAVASTGSGAVSAGAPSMNFPKPAYNSTQAQAEERVELAGIRKKIAQNLQMAKAIIPHFTIMDEADVTQLFALRESLKDFADKNGTKITYLPIVMKALVATLREFPQFNASIDDAASQIVYKKYFNIGFAADTPNGLLVPVIKNADQKTILEISKEIIDLSKRARDGKLKPDEMKGATITITNIGSVGGTYATPIINHPEVAILGMYKIQDKPVLKKDGSIGFIKSMNYTVTADHRLIDGAVAANFLKSFFSKIQNPGVLMMGMS